MFKPPANIDEIGWHPKYPFSPELYEHGDDDESENARRWFEYYGYEYKKPHPDAQL